MMSLVYLSAPAPAAPGWLLKLKVGLSGLRPPSIYLFNIDALVSLGLFGPCEWLFQVESCDLQKQEQEDFYRSSPKNNVL